MVYRYESDEEPFLERPDPGADLSALGPGAPPPTGPSPSRFPAPSLPPPVGADGPVLGRTRFRGTAPVPPPVTSTFDLLGATSRPDTPGPAGPPDPRRSAGDGRRHGGGRTWQLLVGGTAVIMLLALCGLAVSALLRGGAGTPQAVQPTHQPQVQPSTAGEEQNLNSRDTDQLALTAREVFPGRRLVAVDGRPPYPLLKTETNDSCAAAATGEIADLLVRLGCSQVVRATMRSPDGEYLLTAGLFNLTNVSSAERARDRIRQLLENREGRVLGMTAGTGTERVATAAARVGWQVRGHYLAYCLVTRADGRRIDATDPRVREILYEIVERYLNRGVLERRASGETAGQPADGAAQDGTGGRPGD